MAVHAYGLSGNGLTPALPLTVSIVIMFSFGDGLLRDCWLTTGVKEAEQVRLRLLAASHGTNKLPAQRLGIDQWWTNTFAAKRPAQVGHDGTDTDAIDLF